MKLTILTLAFFALTGCGSKATFSPVSSNGSVMINGSSTNPVIVSGDGQTVYHALVEEEGPHPGPRLR